MRFLKTTKQFFERKRLYRRLYMKQPSVEGMVDLSLPDLQAAGQPQDQQGCAREQARPEMKS
jgi:hypothetical protein